MAMGLGISPAIWQTFINDILRQIPHKNRHIAIMDDCLIHWCLNRHLCILPERFAKKGLNLVIVCCKDEMSQHYDVI